MSNYKCPKCPKVFTKKWDYNRHLNRKTSCEFKCDDLLPVSSIKSSNESSNDKIVVNTDENTDENNVELLVDNKLIEVKQSIKNHICEYCQKTFSRSDALFRHKENICKKKKSVETINDASQLSEVKQMLENMQKKDREMMENMQKKDREMEIIKEELLKLRTELNNKTIIKGNVNNQNANNIQNNMQNIHNEIKIIAYGKEDLSFITNENYENILNRGFKSIPHFVEYVHFNKNKPENQNIYISNMRDQYILIFDGEQWQLKERDDVLQELIENKTDFLSDKFDELIDTLDEGTINKFKRFLNERDEDRVIDQIKKDLRLMMYNRNQITQLKPKLPISERESISKHVPKSITETVSEPVTKSLTDTETVTEHTTEPNDDDDNDSTNIEPEYDSDLEQETVIVTKKIIDGQVVYDYGDYIDTIPPINCTIIKKK